MNIIAIIKRVDLTSSWQLIRLCLNHPLFLWPTYRATQRCLKVSTQHFGRAHYQNTPANAFRHAYWNCLIAKYCTDWSKNQHRILDWTKSITDWHENTFKNRPLPRLMDFHNNKVGRKVYRLNKAETIEKLLKIFLDMAQNSLKISSEAEVRQNISTLIHITDYQ